MTPRGAPGDDDGTGSEVDPTVADPADPAQVLRDARSFLAGEAALLEGLGSVLDELAEAEAIEAEAFDTDAMWARVEAQVWPERR
jgi:hypothetical protein